jgi:hypothetical protein
MNDIQCTIIDEALAYLNKYKIDNFNPLIKDYSNDDKYLLNCD